MTHLLQPSAKLAGISLVSVKRLFGSFLAIGWMGQQMDHAPSFTWHYDDCD